MEKFYEVLLISTSVIGLYVSFALLFLSQQNRLLNRLLFIYTITSSLYFLLVYVMIRGWGTAPVVLVRTFTPTALINTAAGYLYFRVLLEDQTRLSRKDLIHLLPFAVNLLYYSPLALDIINGNIPWSDLESDFRPQTYFLHFGPLTEEWIILFRMCVGVFYISWVVIYFFQKHYSELRLIGRHTYPNTIRWIRICLAGYVLFGGSIIFNQSRILFSEQQYSMANGGVNAILVLISWNLLIIYVIMNPEILYGLPNFSQVVSSNISAPVPAKSHTAVREDTSGIKPHEHGQPVGGVKPEKTGTITGLAAPPGDESVAEEKNEMTHSEAVKTIMAQMETYVAIHQPFLNTEFNIATLSKALGVPQHHIAFIFRQVLRRSFVDYRNKLRVDYAIESIRMGRHKQITMDAIGREAGFSSRTTFFHVFKELTGKSPGQYAEEFTPDTSD